LLLLLVVCWFAGLLRLLALLPLFGCCLLPSPLLLLVAVCWFASYCWLFGCSAVRL
jgi:hypothetical protein